MLVTTRGLELWNAATQKRQWERVGDFSAVERIDDHRVLAVGMDGWAEVVATASGEAEKRLCLVRHRCNSENLSLGFVQAFVSRDRRAVVVVDHPLRDSGFDRPPGSITVWSLPDLKQVGGRDFSADELLAVGLRLGPDGALYHDVTPLDVPGLPAGTFAMSPYEAGVDHDQYQRLLFSGGELTVEVVRNWSRVSPDYDRITLFRGNDRLGHLAFGGRLLRKEPGDRGVRRHSTAVSVSPSGERLLLTSPGLLTADGELPAGPTQVWCSPKEPGSLPTVAPAPPPDGDVPSEDPDVLVAQGRAALEEYRHGDAVGLFERALEASPTSVQIRHQLAVALDEMMRRDEARWELRRALAEHPGFIDAHRRLGDIALSRESELEEAARQYSAVTTLAPGDVKAWEVLGGVLLRLGRLSEARDAFAACVRLDRDHPKCGGALRVVERRSGLVSQHEVSAPALSHAAAMFGERDLTADEERAYEECLQRDARYPPCLFGLSRIYQKAGRHQEATAACKKLLEYEPADEFFDEVFACRWFLRKTSAE